MEQDNPLPKALSPEDDMDGSPQESLAVSSEKPPIPRQSSRDRKPTSKMADLQDAELAKKERKFFKCYGVLKLKVKGAREAVKKETKEESIDDIVKSL